MADKTNIEWTDRTWNAIRGCTRVSEGCRNCYAENMAARFSDPGQWGHGLATRKPNRWTGKVVLDEAALLKPLRWKKPRKIFVTSIGDPFHPDVPDEWIDRLFAVMALCPQHTFQLLTKRPERMWEYMNGLKQRAFENDCTTTDYILSHCIDDEWWAGMGRRVPGRLKWPLPNLWLGVSVENQEQADQRIPHLLATPAVVRFLSCEPLLGPINFEGCWVDDPDPRVHINWLERLDWVIVGGESGPAARPMHPDWVRELRDQCNQAQTPFLFKQWGEWAPGETVTRQTGWMPTASWFNDEWRLSEENLATTDNHIDDEPDLYRVGKKAAGRLLDGVDHNGYPGVGK